MLTILFKRIATPLRDSFKRYRKTPYSDIKERLVKADRLKYGSDMHDQIYKEVQKQYGHYAKKPSIQKSIFQQFREDVEKVINTPDQERLMHNQNRKINKAFSEYIQSVTKESAVQKGQQILRKSTRDWIPQQNQLQGGQNYYSLLKSVKSKLAQKNPDNIQQAKDIQAKYFSLLKKLKGFKEQNADLGELEKQNNLTALYPDLHQSRLQQRIRILHQIKKRMLPLHIPFNFVGKRKDKRKKKFPYQILMDPNPLAARGGILSVAAKDKIYFSYLQGWTIRQLSNRFGITPNRAKAVIWQRALFFTEVVPRLGLGYAYSAYKNQQKMRKLGASVDYGLDLQQLKAAQQGIKVHRWSEKLTDAGRQDPQVKNLYFQALKKISSKKKGPKRIREVVGFQGQGIRGYILKNWQFLRGIQSPQLNLRLKTFKSMHEREWDQKLI